MCEPTTIMMAGMALSAAGTMYNNNTQKKTVKAQMAAKNDALAASNILRTAELERQDAMGQQATDRFDENLNTRTVDTQQQRLDDEKMRLETLYNENIPQQSANDAMITGQQNAGKNFDAAQAKSLADTSADTRRRLNALARLQSYGGQNKQNQYDNASTNRGIDTINNFRRGSMSAANLGRQAIINNPTQVTPGSTTLGDIMMGAGQAATFAGAAGWSPSFGLGGGAPGPTTSFINGGGYSAFAPMKGSYTPIVF